jgi:hypothetical protein
MDPVEHWNIEMRNVPLTHLCRHAGTRRMSRMLVWPSNCLSRGSAVFPYGDDIIDLLMKFFAQPPHHLNPLFN